MANEGREQRKERQRCLADWQTVLFSTPTQTPTRRNALWTLHICYSFKMFWFKPPGQFFLPPPPPPCYQNSCFFKTAMRTMCNSENDFWEEDDTDFGSLAQSTLYLPLWQKLNQADGKKGAFFFTWPASRFVTQKHNEKRTGAFRWLAEPPFSATLLWMEKSSSVLIELML